MKSQIWSSGCVKNTPWVAWKRWNQKLSLRLIGNSHWMMGMGLSTINNMINNRQLTKIWLESVSRLGSHGSSGWHRVAIEEWSIDELMNCNEVSDDGKCRRVGWSNWSKRLKKKSKWFFNGYKYINMDKCPLDISSCFSHYKWIQSNYKWINFLTRSGDRRWWRAIQASSIAPSGTQ